MKKTFVSKTELAEAYFPYSSEEAARHRLMRLINKDTELRRRLRESGYTPMARTFSPVQVEMIVKRLGNPFR